MRRACGRVCSGSSGRCSSTLAACRCLAGHRGAGGRLRSRPRGACRALRLAFAGAVCRKIGHCRRLGCCRCGTLGRRPGQPVVKGGVHDLADLHQACMTGPQASVHQHAALLTPPQLRGLWVPCVQHPMLRLVRACTGSRRMRTQLVLARRAERPGAAQVAVAQLLLPAREQRCPARLLQGGAYVLALLEVPGRRTAAVLNTQSAWMARARLGPPQPHPCAHARSCTSTRCGAHPSLINTTFLPTGHILERVSRKLDGSMRGARRWNSVTSTSSCAGAAFSSALLLLRARHRQSSARRAHRAQVRIHLAARAQASSVAPA